jgi:tRNA threonylcarbamoyladenosine biosynthesis protein TsaB
MNKKASGQSRSDGATRDYTLVLEGATYEGSVALLADSVVIAERSVSRDQSSTGERSDRLMPAVAGCFEEAGVKRGGIARIVCGAGPGSFTSLRIAGSVAKGLAVGYGVPLFVVSSLVLTVTGAKSSLAPGEYLSVLDAMRGEFFAARVLLSSDGSATQIEPTAILSTDQIADISARDAVKVIGPGQQIDAMPQARGVAGMLRAILERGPVDLASWEPDYGRLAEAQVRWEATHGRPLLP